MIAEKLEYFNKKAGEFNASVVAISKTKPPSDIMIAYETGHRIFGENKVQEMVEKSRQLPSDIQWHYVGHLQRNKVKFIAPFVNLIHAVDSLRLLQSINKEAVKFNRTISILLQVYIAKEETKFGLSETELFELLNNEELTRLQNIQIVGLMGMATNTEDFSMIDGEFKLLNHLFNKIDQEIKLEQVEMKHLSMGMTNDYSIALQNGATLIRIGTAIFGARN